MQACCSLKASSAPPIKGVAPNKEAQQLLENWRYTVAVYRYIAGQLVLETAGWLSARMNKCCCCSSTTCLAQAHITHNRQSGLPGRTPDRKKAMEPSKPHPQAQPPSAQELTVKSQNWPHPDQHNTLQDGYSFWLARNQVWDKLPAGKKSTQFAANPCDVVDTNKTPVCVLFSIPFELGNALRWCMFVQQVCRNAILFELDLDMHANASAP